MVEVDAFPGETFVGRIARVAPVLDPATRTASIEIEIPNPGFRLKPGMYARVTVTTDERKDALVVPANAVIDLGGRRGVFLAAENDTVSFRPVSVGIDQDTQVEILQGLAEGDRVVTVGAAALREGDRVLIAGSGGGRRGDTAAGDDGASSGTDPARDTTTTRGTGVNPTNGGTSAPLEGARRGGGRRGQGTDSAPTTTR